MAEHESGASNQSLPAIQNLKPDRTYYIVPHSNFTKKIEIFDLTSQVKEQHDSEALKEEIKTLVKSSHPESCLTISKSNFWGTELAVHEPPAGATIVEWKGSARAHGPSRFTFPADSSHSTHPIELKPSKFWTKNEQFVQDSITYSWEFDSNFSQRKLTLYKCMGVERVVVAKYCGMATFKTGGILLLDSEEVDEIIAVITCCAMLRKKRQRDS